MTEGSDRSRPKTEFSITQNSAKSKKTIAPTVGAIAPMSVADEF